jgi:serine/threonine protein kinase
VSRKVGDKIGGRYTLAGSIGQGGGGEVWEALDDVLGRTVAVKCALPHLTKDPQAIQLLLQESQAASHLFGLPHIVAILDVVVDAHGPCVVMEYLPGTNGRAFAAKYLTKRGDHLTRTALALYVAFCGAKALMHAHEKGVIHRDVKPANLLISEGGVVKLSDFGLAKFAQDATRAVTGKFGGTLLYMAPEQVNGQPGSVATDLYQLGCLLYELMEGQAPFENEPSSAALVLAKLYKAEPDPTTMNGILAEEKSKVIDLYRGLVNATPKGRWQAWQAVESLASILHRPSWRLEFGANLASPVLDRVREITRFSPTHAQPGLDYEDPEEALSEALALTLAGVGNQFVLKRPNWFKQKVMGALRKP